MVLFFVETLHSHFPNSIFPFRLGNLNLHNYLGVQIKETFALYQVDTILIDLLFSEDLKKNHYESYTPKINSITWMLYKNYRERKRVCGEKNLSKDM